MATTYLYSVSPKKPIRFLCGAAVVPPIRTPRSIQMTLEQVKDCLKYGSVYRRFAEEGRNERVTTANVERLHNAHFLTEEEFNCLVSNDDAVIVETIKAPVEEENKRGRVEISEKVEPTIMAVEETKEIPEINEDEEELVEETEIENSISDEIVDTVVETEEEFIDEEVEDEVQDELEEDIVEETTVTEDEESSASTESYSNKNSYNYNNKNRKKNRH